MGTKSRTRRWRLTAAALVATLFGSLLAAVAPSAEAAVGDLAYVQCIRDSSLPRDGCGQITPAVAGTEKVVVSPDGRFAYAVAFDHIVGFARDQWGGLTWRSCLGAGAACSASTGVKDIEDLVISPDGKNAYIASY